MARRRETPLGRAVKDGPQVTLTMAKAWNSFPRLLRKSCSATDHGVSNPLFDIFLRLRPDIKAEAPPLAGRATLRGFYAESLSTLSHVIRIILY